MDAMQLQKCLDVVWQQAVTAKQQAIAMSRQALAIRELIALIMATDDDNSDEDSDDDT
jgi:hypothetical protein